MPDRSLLGLGALAVAGLVIVAAPVSYRIATTWDGALTWAGMLLACGTLLALGLAWAWAYRHRPILDAETVKTLGRLLELEAKQREQDRKRLAEQEQKLLTVDQGFWPQPVREDYTVEADSGR